MTYKIFSKLSVAALYMLIAAPAQSLAQQNIKKLTLDEAVQLSIKNSAQLKTANAKVGEAIATYHEAWNNHLPDVKVSGSYMRLNSPNVNMKIRLGGSDTSKSAVSAIKVKEAAYGNVNASLPLFSGFRIKYGVESAKYLEQAAKLDADNDKESVIMNTVLAFSNLYKASRSVGIVRENLKQQQQRVADFSNLEKNGLLARNDLLKTQLQQSNIELSVLDAENDLKMTFVNMNLMLGLPEDTELIPDTAGFHIQTDIGSAIQWEQTALQNRKDIASLTYMEKAATSNIKATKGEYYPGLALTGGLIAADVPGLLTITNALNIGIGLQYNLGALWKTGAKVAAANAHLHQVQYSQSILSDQIKSEINKSYYDYLLTLKKIEVYAKAVEQADENYRITKNKYDNSLATTTDLLEADVAQLQARLNHTLAQAEALVRYKKLQQTAGIISNSFPSTNK
ncbi:MAG: TolC family protein [Chitinophagales bacterium]